jgi:A/G-specific adenine glycosylase
VLTGRHGIASTAIACHDAGVASTPPHPDLGALTWDVLSWFRGNYRPLPWRNPPYSADNRMKEKISTDTGESVTAWGVMVSEIMLQQTPVARVEPVWREWLHRWPTPGDLAAARPAEVIRAWGRLGYPRRALRLHAAANTIVERHGGIVPDSFDELRALPGVGEYTAGAILAFAYGQRAVALDTNVRRVLARYDAGRPRATGSVTAAERERAWTLLPAGSDAPVWMAAIMELGAVVCTARDPRCEVCPVSQGCRWRAAGYPDGDDATRRQPRYAGSDRQVRGAILELLRQSPGPVTQRRLDMIWPDEQQRRRALDSLVGDGLVEPLARGRYQLPE